jgi:hypothetical protein
MSKKFWLKGALLLTTGACLAVGLGFPGGCLDAAVQRILVAVNFD